MIARRVAAVIDSLAAFAAKHRDLPCLGFTHFQPAQPTTVGKRACLWAYDLAMDLAEIEHRIASLKALGNKGTTGTQASFLELFHGDHAKVRKLEELICRKIGFDAAYAVSGQTYSRKIDSQVLGDALRRGPKRAQDGHRPAAAGPSQGGGGAVREGSDRLVGDGLQAEPDAERADLLAGPVRHEPGIERRADGLGPMARTDVGRQRQPPA